MSTHTKDEINEAVEDVLDEFHKKWGTSWLWQFLVEQDDIIDISNMLLIALKEKALGSVSLMLDDKAEELVMSWDSESWSIWYAKRAERMAP